MGEVYRALDPRLGREVAIKVLPPSFSADPGRLRRFEQEARAAGVLNHPNVTAVYDVGTHDGAPYVVQELLEGETLREILNGGRLSPRRAIEYSLQVAHGLAAAHEKGIVHRDLKPENLFVTKDGRVKILDFGLAKLEPAKAGAGDTDGTTATAGTEAGVVLGTLGYMSPEQLRGSQVDVRSDIFSLGAIVYEMLSGTRPFQGKSAADTISAILREDPPDLSVVHGVSPALYRIVSHCLEKNPEQRFRAADDVAFALNMLAFHPTTSPVSEKSPRPAVGMPRLIEVAALTVILIAAVLLASEFARKPIQPVFKRLTFRRGTVWTARFAPDGQTVVYSAAWENEPVQVYLTRPESPESRPLELQNASLLGVSPTAELALMMGAKTTSAAYQRFGTLARVPLAGGSPRPVLENVRYADWGPAGKDLLVEREVGGKHRIEFPIGKVVYESTNRLATPRVSPKGNAIAFFEVSRNLGFGSASVRTVDLAGNVRTLASVSAWWNLGWSPNGDEIWYAAPEPGAAPDVSSLQAVTLSGRHRLLLRIPGTLELHDISRDGRVLLARVSGNLEVIGRTRGDSKERRLSWLDGSWPSDLSPDGKTLLITEWGEGGGAHQSIYVRKTDGSPATLIGEGVGHALSPDGQWVLSTTPTDPPQLVLLPTGAGATRRLRFEGITGPARGMFFPDGKRLLLQENEPGELPQLFVGSVDGGKPRPLAPKGITVPPFGHPISPDGRLVVVEGTDGTVLLCPADGGDLKPVPNMREGEFPIQWSADGRFLYTHRGGELPARVWRLEIATARKELFQELSPDDPAGVTSIESILMTSDALSCVYHYFHNLSDLYIVDGLK